MRRRQHFICLNPRAPYGDTLAPPPLALPPPLLRHSSALHSRSSTPPLPHPQLLSLATVAMQDQTRKSFLLLLLLLVLLLPLLQVGELYGRSVRARFPVLACVFVRACVRCRRSMGTGLSGCQLQSGLTCASNVVYCPNTSPEENLSRPLKFKAIYHPHPQPHLRPSLALPLCQSPSSSSSCPSSSVSVHHIHPPPPPHGLILEFRRL